MNYKVRRDGPVLETEGFYPIYASRKLLAVVSRDESDAKFHNLWDPDFQAFVEVYFSAAFINRPIKKSAAMIAHIILLHHFGREKAVKFTRRIFERFMPVVGIDSGCVEVIRISDAELLAEVIEANAKPSPV